MTGGKVRVVDLKPGQELDARVAAAVFGWAETSVSMAYFGHATPQPYAMGCPPGLSSTERVPPFSTSLEAAWKVLDHFTALGFYPRLHRCGSGWWCHLERSGDEARPPHAHSEHGAPHAIALAALKAVGAIE